MADDYSSRKFILVSDSQARNRAVVIAGRTIAPGEVILKVPSLVTSLLPKWRGKRCDWCCRDTRVNACSRCKEVWYCSGDCQTRAWKTHHRRICSLLSRGFHLSASFMGQDIEQQANTDLLLNLWGSISLPSDEDNWSIDNFEVDLQRLASDPALCFKSLMHHPKPRMLPDLPSPLLASHPNFLNSAWTRFDCNNFVVHNVSSAEAESGSYALGIFPLASRCFNHSCAPNAWSAFRLRNGQVWLEVRALEEIRAGAEIAIPYLDAALSYRERQLRLSQVYGFECLCTRCKLENQLPEPTTSSQNSDLLEAAVSSVVFGQSTEDWQVQNRGAIAFTRLPSSARHEDFMKNLSQRFESHAHDGPYEEGWLIGRTLLALCLIVYPENYPLIGYYATTLATACWNAYVLTPDPLWISRTTNTLKFSRRILEVAGGEEEADAAVGLATCETLESLIAAEPLP